jgi:putative ABC transport system permease protein
MRQEVDYWARRTPIGFVISAGLVVGFIVGAVIVYQILYTDLTDHLREYAVLKATGCSDTFLHGIVWQQSVILALGGFLPATFLAWIVLRVTRAATSLPAGLSPGPSILVLGLTTGMCVVAGTLALRVLREADPADVF